SSIILFLFFFQAEDGIRDRNVTGVQTCALPILLGHEVFSAKLNGTDVSYDGTRLTLENLQESNEVVVSSSSPYSTTGEGLHRYRSEERRVGKECRQQH